MGWGGIKAVTGAALLCRQWNGSFLVLQLIGEPVQALVETVSASGACSLDVPVTVAERVKAELVCDLCRVHGVGKILTRRVRGWE